MACAMPKPVVRAPVHDAQDQHVEGALDELTFLPHLSHRFLMEARGEWPFGCQGAG